MKLYTEEELLKAMAYSRSYDANWVMTENEILKLITPIELPNDEKNKSYWEKRCELAENYIDESPCCPDITNDQLKAYSQWKEFINQNK
jgi:hypothetical protein